MAERDCECKIITFVGNTSGMLKRYEILCNGTNGGGCLYDEIWSGEGIDNVARRHLTSDLGIEVATETKVNSYCDGHCSKPTFKKSSGMQDIR
jgi:hypothetical protein